MVESDQFNQSRFECFEQSPEAVHFFTNITGNLEVSTPDMIGYLESWIASGTTVTVQQQSLDIDRNYNLVRASNIGEECTIGFMMQELMNTSMSVNVSVISFFSVLCVLVLSLLVVAMVYIKTRMKRQIKSSEVQQEPT